MNILVSMLLAASPCLHGNVKFVKYHADYKVFVKKTHADMRVKKVDAFPDDPGEWRVVESFPDFTVQIVSNESQADFTITWVNSFPGCQKTSSIC